MSKHYRIISQSANQSDAPSTRWITFPRSPSNPPKPLEAPCLAELPARDRKMLREYVLILANTGIRIGEARYLKWSDLREIPSPKGSNQPPEIALNVKGKTGQRTVVSSGSHIKDYFKRILEMRTEELSKKPDNESYIFCGKDGKAIISFKKSFATLLKFVGIEKDENEQRHTIYSLRHTAICMRIILSKGQVNIFNLAKNAGTSVDQIERFYARNLPLSAEMARNLQSFGS